MKNYPIHRNNRFFKVYSVLEPHLVEGNKITIKQVWSWCNTYEGVKKVGLTGFRTISNHFKSTMDILIQTGHVVKIKRGVWLIKMTPENINR